VSVARRQRRHDPTQVVRAQRCFRGLFGRDGGGVSDEVAEFCVPVLTDRLVQRNGRPCQGPERLDFVNADVEVER
jgi:hypothetical protein